MENEPIIMRAADLEIGTIVTLRPDPNEKKYEILNKEILWTDGDLITGYVEVKTLTPTKSSGVFYLKQISPTKKVYIWP